MAIRQFIYLIPVAVVFGDLLNPGLIAPFFRTLLTATFSAICFGGAIIGYSAGLLKIWLRPIVTPCSHPPLAS